MRKMLIVGLGLVVAVTGCGGDSGDSAGSESAVGSPSAESRPLVGDRDAWADLRIQGDEVEGYTAFEEMRDAADGVVVGVFTGFAPGRAFQGDAEEDQFWYINGTVEVSEVIQGEWTAPTTIEVEFISSATDADSLDADIAALNAGVGGGESVLFLRDKGGAEAGLLRLVNSYGLVTTTAELPVDVPLGEVPTEEEPGAASSRTEVQDPRAEWATLEDFIADMRS